MIQANYKMWSMLAVVIQEVHKNNRDVNSYKMETYELKMKLDTFYFLQN